MTKKTPRHIAPDFSPALMPTEVEAGEKRAEGWGPVRRIAYATLTQSSTKMLADLKKDENYAHALLDVVKNIEDYLDWREEETKLLKAASARIVWALTHNACITAEL
jgi:hypothetical protein